MSLRLEIRRISGHILRTSSRNVFATRGTKKISLVGFELRTSIFTELLAHRPLLHNGIAEDLGR
jgi:hypothetical protein